MSAYLSAGIIMAIKTNCSEEQYLPQLKTEIAEKIIMPIEDFEMMKDQDGHFNFYLPAKYFGTDLAEFLSAQNKMCNNRYGDISKILAKIGNVKNLYELKKLGEPIYNQIFHR